MLTPDRLTEVLTSWRDQPHLCEIFPAVAHALLGQRAASFGQRGLFDPTKVTEALALDGVTSACVVLIDGLGYQALSEHLAYAPFLRGRRADILAANTVIPSSTAAAITAATTGSLPGQTGMTGWSAREGDQVMNLLSFTPPLADPATYQLAPTVFEFLAENEVGSVAINSTAFADSGLTRAALRGARHRGADTLAERLAAARAAWEAGTALTYLYWHGLDHAGHGHGYGSPQWCEALEQVDRMLGELAKAAPAGSALILCADHGMVNTRPDTRLDVAHIPALREGVRMIAGEGRAVHLHAEPGQEQAVVQRWRDYLGERSLVVTGPELGELLGEGPGLERVGTALALMDGQWVVGDSRTQPQSTLNLTGVHGSLTERELLIPLARLA